VLEVAEGVWQMPGLVPHLINTWLIRVPAGDVLVDAGTRWAAPGIVRRLRGRTMAMVALTHVHPDHQGAAAAVCRRFGVPLACHADDVDAMEGRRRMAPRTLPVRLFDRLWSGPPHPVEVRWRGGEMLGEWRVVHAPGHTPGHVVFFRERDRAAVVGDVVRNFTFRGGLGRLAETPHVFSVDPARNRESMRLLLGLRPRILCCGHGPPHRDSGELERLVRRVDGAGLTGSAWGPRTS
jgi:glyoxylase-like metal-dependent hydrolase (beta-lactamase superfamily II)